MKRKRGRDYVSASELARLGFCERQVAFDDLLGLTVTRSQQEARDRGDCGHAAFHEEGVRIAQASVKKGRCFIATLVLGDCDDTRALRTFRDLFLRRSFVGRRIVFAYYRWSPMLCGWLGGRPRCQRMLARALRPVARLAAMLVRQRLRPQDD